MYKKSNFLNEIELITATSARKNISEIINQVAYSNRIFAIGRRNKIEALIIKYPKCFNENLSAITNYSANSSSFKFLEEEPELYN